MKIVSRKYSEVKVEKLTGKTYLYQAGLFYKAQKGLFVEDLDAELLGFVVF